jgi:hypothetical protein
MEGKARPASPTARIELPLRCCAALANWCFSGSYGFSTIVESFATGPGAPAQAVGHDALLLKYCDGLSTI